MPRVRLRRSSRRAQEEATHIQQQRLAAEEENRTLRETVFEAQGRSRAAEAALKKVSCGNAKAHCAAPAASQDDHASAARSQWCLPRQRGCARPLPPIDKAQRTHPYCRANAITSRCCVCNAPSPLPQIQADASDRDKQLRIMTDQNAELLRLLEAEEAQARQLCSA
jgi:hypothetical protein